MQGFNHPYFFRTVFYDGEAPEFVVKLISFALKLRNWGFSDKDLISHLSEFVSGNIYSDQGHSTLYENVDVFK